MVCIQKDIFHSSGKRAGNAHAENRRNCTQYIAQALQNHAQQGQSPKLNRLFHQCFQGQAQRTEHEAIALFQLLYTVGKIDVVGRLVDLVESEAASVVNNEYTLPYVMVALEQSEDYITEEQREYLIGKALSLSTNWQNVSWGTDALTPMLLALAPYYDNNTDVKSEVDKEVKYDRVELN